MTEKTLEYRIYELCMKDIKITNFPKKDFRKIQLHFYIIVYHKEHERSTEFQMVNKTLDKFKNIKNSWLFV